MKKCIWFLLPFCFLASKRVLAQVPEVLQSVHGNFQVEAQNCNNDTAIGTQDVGGRRFRSNMFGNINYTYGDFTMGFRFESYQPVMLGFDERYSNKSGIPYRFARYKRKDIDITVGNFYEQFGSGLCFRSYEERGLLWDNSVDGMRVVLTPKEWLTLKGIYGRQRVFWGLSDGVVRGFDGEISLLDIFDSLKTDKLRILLGGSFVSKYQQDQNPVLKLPENVGCSAGRINIIAGDFNFFTEYAYKINDPSFQNHYSFKDGQALYVSTSYAQKGLSVLLSGKYIDNMSFRSDRDQSLTAAQMNFLPALTKPHTYLMMAYYPYASLPNGEIGAMGEVQYKFKKGSFLGGKYGMDVTFNCSVSMATDTTGLDPYGADSTRLHRYKVSTNSAGDKLWHDINIEINKKLSKTTKLTFMYANQYLNQSYVQFNTLDKTEHPDVLSNIFVLDVTHRYRTGSAIRVEGQLFLGEYKYGGHDFHPNGERNIEGNTGSWVTGAIEWTPSSKWFVVLMDQFNYSNPLDYKQLHYYYGGIGYVNGPTRITMSYGRQRQGIFCAGGVCRLVPAFSGFSIGISSSF